ncbi:MAG: tRNA uridine-5-carboxymethylaminomethyl(34) synthesis GTPase MnmE, partial [Deltaproteobacteria bacterium]|nr:tRNA uridine-5-carboxymethylaminomethyl(34) synthesis GTPase MnmE [Deltaproteobacteria bacterium]
VDDGYIVYFKSPHSFTGEDVIEIQIHGSPYTLNQCVELCLAKGARLAGPGEFTQRAFIHEKIDLIQAEAVSELIHAQSEVEAMLARKRLDGKLSEHITQLRNAAISILAELDADVDFPDEELPLSRIDQRVVEMEKLQVQAEKILQTYRQNETVREGYRICFIGRPNAGKSSFFNKLLQSDRAIVTDIAGTTRDTISESIYLRGRKVTLIDTAGLRSNTDDVIEAQGMDRAMREIKQANMVCLICDVQAPIDPDLLSILQEVERDKRALIYNKMDLHASASEPHPDFAETFFVSSKTGLGVDGFFAKIAEKLDQQQLLECGGGISNDRQRELLQTVMTQILQSKQALLQQDSPEFIAFEFRQAFEALNRLVGKDDGYEDVYDHIFSTFCIGK